MSKHTPAPWYRIPRGDEWSRWGRGDIGTKEPKPETMDGDNWWTVASVNGLRDEADANANLIAAAPELLEALIDAEAKLCVAEYHLDRGEDDSIMFETEILNARAAIAKARGDK